VDLTGPQIEVDAAQGTLATVTLLDPE